ncbi:hypothetical protein L3Q82_012478 [Scortum barcoo]|uniref:Uncharacterized protein n=1 Tax=Scortum barcoo TaxID=214431 RepID=A0ACB8W336_9TELE|nr:hypothetical protein L3Q82_012478 [Scortum barcoo]
MEQLAAPTRLQQEYRECSLMHFTETLAEPPHPGLHWCSWTDFISSEADRNTRESGKKKGGGIALFVNDKWCNPGHIHVKEQRCTRDRYHPAVLPAKFSHVITITTYIPPSANADAACKLLHTVVAQLQTEHPQAFLLITGDFNHASLSATLPNFHQYVNCCTRDNKTLDLLYANTAGAYSSSPLPPLGRSDHNLTWEVLCGPHEQDTDSLTDCITDYINFCVETTVPTRRVRCFSNNKPWVTPDLRALLLEKKRAFQSGDRDELRRLQRDLKWKIKECKASYRRKMEDHLQQKNAREVWRGLQAISGQGNGEKRNPEPGDRDWANKLNLFSPLTFPLHPVHIGLHILHGQLPPPEVLR